MCLCLLSVIALCARRHRFSSPPLYETFSCTGSDVSSSSVSSLLDTTESVTMTINSRCSMDVMRNVAAVIFFFGLVSLLLVLLYLIINNKEFFSH